jgi:signal peptidase II
MTRLARPFMPPDEPTLAEKPALASKPDLARWRRVFILVTSLVLGLAVLQIDRLVKVALVNRFMVERAPWPVEVTSYFDLVMVWNRGISFGLFQSDETGRWLLVGLAGIVSLALVVWIWRAANLWVGVALGLILGGAIGNAWDRFLWGAVADFFDVHAFGYHFWAFNIADVGISVGVTMLVLDSLLPRGRTA